jgi:hypothetical protein
LHPLIGPKAACGISTAVAGEWLGAVHARNIRNFGSPHVDKASSKFS